ncbi:dihydropteroate synthase [Terrimonas ferruginea]|uniref:dihydropteroate synthase n=1 Tax=Terrimonas ferruginea TaxID=249 RepID=UPI000423A0F9|nr:dihydropteroate synthase [Terrimonas ferruginea]
MFTLNCKGRLLAFDRPLIMGIINTTPDSFYQGSRHAETDEVLRTAEQMIKSGAAILDIGGQSTRPGSRWLGAEEELSRVLPSIEAISRRFPEIVISIDTFHALVARRAVEAGASIVNDISAGSMDEALIKTVAELQVPYVLMHMQGTPGDMQQAPQYGNVVTEVFDFLAQKIVELREAGVHDILIDPGFGFGKTIDHNFQLLRKLEVFASMGMPLLAGLSRKSTIYKTLGITAEEAVNGTTVLNTIALQKGAAVLRVHDVKEARECVLLLERYNHA